MAPRFWWILLSLLSLLEVLLLTAARNSAGPYLSPWLVLVSGLCIGCIPLYTRQEPVAAPLVPTHSQRLLWRDAGVCGLLFVLGTVSATNLVKGNLRTTPIQVATSDVVPQLQILVQRWLSGTSPYQPIEFGHPYEFFPAYLPAHWAPFALFQAPQVDYRLGATWLLWAALLIPLISLVRAAIPLWRKVLWLAAAFVVFDFFALTSGFMFAVAVEQLMMGYYLLLFVALTDSRRIGVWAAALLACLLSRFGLVFWVPVLLLAVWWSRGLRQSVRLFGWLAAGVLLLYVWPFVLPDPTLLARGQHTYQAATLIEWQMATERPHLFGGQGLALYFWEMPRLHLSARLQALQLTTIGASLLTGAALLLFYRSHRHRLPLSAFAVGSLKIMLSVFYALVQIPYDYLYLVPAGATLGVLYWAVKFSPPTPAPPA